MTARPTRWLAPLAVAIPVIAFAGQPQEAAPAVAVKDSDTQRALQDAERTTAEQLIARKEAADRAAAAAARATQLAAERVSAAAKLRQAEAETAEIAARIDTLAQRRQAAEQRVQDRAKAIQPLLPLIERLSLYPAETLLAVPALPDQALRGVLVLQSITRQIEVETEALRNDQDVADAAAEALRAEAPRLADAAAVQKRQADALDMQIVAARKDEDAAEAQGKAAATLAAAAASRADSLRAALAAIEAQGRVDEAKAREDEVRAERHKRTADAQAAHQRGLAAAHPTGTGTIAAGTGPRGQLQPPVIGVVVRSWGDRTDGGPSTGLYYHAPPGAHVISPCGGKVVFAQTFRSYGLLLIIDCGGGYHVVLAGFERLDVKVGQNLLAGEPVGVMSDWEPGASTPRPSLYVELRHDGTPVNPAPWLRSNG